VIRKQKQLFKTRIVPGKKGSGKLFEEEFVVDDGPVECLGMTFENDEKRREYFLKKLRDKLKDPEFRKIEGFPIGEDKDILALSDPPYYTACPNPFIEDFIKHYGKPYDPATDDYRREPFAADVSEGKNDPIYNAHSYHTKVPHKAIMRYILHYTEPGDVVFDGFCGTGMTGVAAQACASPPTDFKSKIEGEWQGNSQALKWGERKAILCDLSPAATFIANNYNIPIDIDLFEKEAVRIIAEVEEEQKWMWETTHSDGRSKGSIKFTVWSDVFICPQCSDDIIFYDAAVDAGSGKVSSTFSCPHCATELGKRGLQRSLEAHYDKWLSKTIKRPRRVPVLIAYRIGRRSFQKRPDQDDLALLNRIAAEIPPHFVPTPSLMFKNSNWGDLQRGYHEGITHAHHFYFERTLWALSELANRNSRAKANRLLNLLFTSQLINISKMNRYRPGVSFPYNPMSGTLYVGSQICESNPFIAYRNKIKKFVAAKKQTLVTGSVSISTASTSQIEQHIPHESIDYIFVDPPFGDNLPYSELSFLWESWLRVFTNNQPEAIISGVQNKGLPEYTSLMLRCFKAMHSCLKPGRWMTVEFHNSRNSVWSAIQEALGTAGFVIADVRILDKGGKTKKQITGANAVKQDLVISAYKPNGGLEERFKLSAGTEDGVWDFVRTHLKQLPVFVSKSGQAEVIAERQNYLLFDRMVAFHVQRGVTVPLSAAEFYSGLEQRFSLRDGMYFLPDQAAKYDKKRMTVKEVLQLQLFVSDEASAIQWLKQQLTKKPQTFQDIHPQFLKKIGGWQKHEKALELSELLEQNFLRYDGKGEVPSQIHSYLSSNFKELRNLEKDDSALKAKAKDRWYVPDPNKAGDLEKLRERTLLREFEEYRESKQKRLKVFRLEAVRAGFKKAWQERDYGTIIAVARKIPDKILQEDPKLLMWFDQAVTRTCEAETR
jgi:hypothetical protein